MRCVSLLALAALSGPTPVREVFIFGLGYTGARIAAAVRRAHPQVPVTGTTRAARSPVAGADIAVFDGGTLSDDALQALQRASHVVSTIPPGPDLSDPVLPLLRSAGPSEAHAWFGYVSTTSVYGDHGGAWVTEESEARAPAGSAGAARLLIEQEWREAARQQGCVAHVFRAAGIYGPGRSLVPLVQQLGPVAAVASCGGDAPVSRVHVDDLAGAIAACMRLGQASVCEVWNVADHWPAPRAEVARYTALALFRGAPRSLPAGRAPRPGLQRASRRGKERKRVCGDRLRERAGYAFRYPSYHSGVDAIVAAGGDARAP